MKRSAYLLVLISSVLCTHAFAYDESKKGHHRPEPPKQAIEACAAATLDEACVFEGRRGEMVEGQCYAPSEDRPLACRPADRKHGSARSQEASSWEDE